MTEKTEALRLVDVAFAARDGRWHTQADDELRRLHVDAIEAAAGLRRLSAVEAQRDALLEACRAMLTFIERHAPRGLQPEPGSPVAKARAALAQQAEPVVGVVWGVDWGRDGDRACASIVKKRADGSVEIVAVEYAPYTAPPQRKPLTKEQLLYIYNQLPNWGMDMDRLPQGLEKFARAVERAHGITDPATPACPDCHGIPMPEGDPK